MKTIRTTLTLFLAAVLLLACAPQTRYSTYHMLNLPQNETYAPFSFDYPEDWAVQEGNTVVVVASQPQLLLYTPDVFETEDVLLLINVASGSLPLDALGPYASRQLGLEQVGEITSYQVDGLPAAYFEGANPDTGDQYLIVARSLPGDASGLVLGRFAQGALQQYKPTVLKIADSLRFGR